MAIMCRACVSRMTRASARPRGRQCMPGGWPAMSGAWHDGAFERRADAPLKISYITDVQDRDACLAMLCASVFGREAGLAPLVEFAGVSRLLEQESARIVALFDDGARLCSVALLTLEVEGRGVELRLLTTPEKKRGRGYGRRLVTRLGESTAMRTTTSDPRLEAFFTTFGFERWYRHSDSDLRSGFNARSGVDSLSGAPEVVDFQTDAVLRAFKRDPALFERYKTRFAEGVGHFNTLV